MGFGEWPEIVDVRVRWCDMLCVGLVVFMCVSCVFFLVTVRCCVLDSYPVSYGNFMHLGRVSYHSLKGLSKCMFRVCCFLAGWAAVLLSPVPRMRINGIILSFGSVVRFL